MPNIQFRCPRCNQPIEQPAEMLGQLIDCPACGEVVEVQKSIHLPPPPRPGPRPVPRLKLPKPPPHAPAPARLKEYKVLAPSDERFAGGVTPAKLEEALNAYAAKGWQVAAALHPRHPDGAEASRDDWMLILGRTK